MNEMREAYLAEIGWFFDHPYATERLRPATVEEQTRMFQETGGAVFDSIRVVRGGWFRTDGEWAAILRLVPPD